MTKINLERRDHLRIELKRVRSEMGSISPKLSIHKKLQDEEKRLLKELENNHTV